MNKMIRGWNTKLLSNFQLHVILFQCCWMFTLKLRGDAQVVLHFRRLCMSLSLSLESFSKEQHSNWWPPFNGINNRFSPSNILLYQHRCWWTAHNKCQHFRNCSFDSCDLYSNISLIKAMIVMHIHRHCRESKQISIANWDGDFQFLDQNQKWTIGSGGRICQPQISKHIKWIAPNCGWNENITRNWY